MYSTINKTNIANDPSFIAKEYYDVLLQYQPGGFNNILYTKWHIINITCLEQEILGKHGNTCR